MEYSDDYGFLVTVRSQKDTFLFIDETDMERYMLILIRSLRNNNFMCGEPKMAGLCCDAANIVFCGGEEDRMRHLMRTVHAAYGSYRKSKGCSVKFGRSSYILLDGTLDVVRTMKSVRYKFDHICMSFGNSEDGVPPGTVVKRLKLCSGKIPYDALADIAFRYTGSPIFTEFLANSDIRQKQCAAKELRCTYELTYKEIGEIFLCSAATAHRIVNNAS